MRLKLDNGICQIKFGFLQFKNNTIWF